MKKNPSYKSYKIGYKDDELDSIIGERRADEQERIMLIDRLVSATEMMIQQSGKQNLLISSLSEKVIEMKLDIQKIAITGENIAVAFRNQVNNCMQRHEDFEGRLRTVPGDKEETNRDDRIKALEDNHKKLEKDVYKFIGKCMGVMSVIVILISVITPWLLRKYGG